MPAFRPSALAACVAAALAVGAPLAATQPESVDTVRSSAGMLRVERLASLEYPWGLAVLPDGRVLVTEKPGRLRVWRDGSLSEPVRGLPDIVWRGGKSEQGGLMDVAIDPDFAKNRRIYVAYSEAATAQPADARNPPDPRLGSIDPEDVRVIGGAVARATLDGDRLTDLTVIWRQVPKTAGRGHFGHRLVFGPDKLLYVTSGDRMRFDPAQAPDSNLGKVVRITTDGAPAPGNPFLGRGGQREDVYSTGHRNMIAAAMEPRTSRLWVFEMGPLGGDELNVVQAGRNYGWPTVSDGDNYDRSPIPDHATRPGEFQAPLRTWTPVISPSGAMFYDGKMFPAWRGDALVGSLSARAIVRLKTDGRKVTDEERIDLQRRVRDVAQSREGALLVITDDEKGELLRLSPAQRAVAAR